MKIRALAGALAAVLCVLAGTASSSPVPRTYGHVRITEADGLGRIDVHERTAAVLSRTEGIVTLVDTGNPRQPKILGRYDDGAKQSLDGDLAFSHDGRYLFYARQTVQFSKDGLHVLDVADPKAPALTDYEPGGGAFRVDTYFDGTTEWVFLLDAVSGFVVYRFVPEAGQLVPVQADVLPALKVGGPASAGFFVEEKDPKLGIPLLYVTTGSTGLQVFDISDPLSPVELGAWEDAGLAEVEVVSTKRGRMVYAATEYWFNKTQPPEVVVLDGTDLAKLKEVRRMAVTKTADDKNRIQGMTLDGSELLVAHTDRGVISFPSRDEVETFRTPACARPKPGSDVICSVGLPPVSVTDVEVDGGALYVSNAATGVLSIVTPVP